MKHTTLPVWPGQVDTAPGNWRLVHARAMSLFAGEDTHLQAVAGGLWVTLNQPHVGPGNASGDHFLSPGESLTVPAGSHVVMEPWSQAGQGDAHFNWENLPVPEAAPVSIRWQLGVLQPLADLRAGLAAVGSALRGLTIGLAFFASNSVAETVRALCRGAGFRALMAVSNAVKAQTRIS